MTKINHLTRCAVNFNMGSWLIASIGLTGLISECQALQEQQKSALKQARDPYYNPRLQNDSNPALQGTDKRLVNPLFPAKPDAAQPVLPVESSAATKSVAKGVQILPKWEPPAPKFSAIAHPASGSAGALNPLKSVPPPVSNPSAAAHSLAPNSIIRNSTTNPSREIVRDFSADLSKLNRPLRPVGTPDSSGAAGSQPGEMKPGEMKPGEMKPGEMKPGEMKPGEMKLGEMKLGEMKPGEMKPGEMKPGEMKPGEMKPGEMKPGEMKPGSDKAALQSPASKPSLPIKPIAPSTQPPGTPRLLPQATDSLKPLSNPIGFKPNADNGGPKSQTIAPSTASKSPAENQSGRFSNSNQEAPKSEPRPPSANSTSTKSLAISSLNPNLEPTRLLAMVGNEPIFVGDILFELNQMIEQHLAQAPEAIKDRERQNGIGMLLKKYIDAKLLYIDTLRKLPEGADVEKIVDQAAQEFDKTAAPTMMKEAGIKSLADFDAYLRLRGTSLRKLRLHWSKDQLTRYFMAQELEYDKEVSHRELLDEYQKNLESYAIPAKARWEQITVRFDKTASREEAERMLVEMGNKIVYGANFASVAKKGSHGFTASNGGLHDWIGKNELASKELDKALFSEEIGKLSDKLETAEGLHIIRVLERTEASHTPFVDAQLKIKEELLNKKRAAAFEKHLSQLRQEIPVVRYDQNEPPAVRVAENINR